MKLKKLYKFFSQKGTHKDVPGTVVIQGELLKKLHSVLLEIVDDIIQVCEDNRLTCFLGGGSALGAIRHHGFIPWDDDIDINMPRKSYETFIPMFQKQFGEKYWVHTPENHPELGSLVVRIRKKGTLLRTNDMVFDDSEAGIFVDIFIIENVPDNVVFRTAQGILANTLKACSSCRKFYRDRKKLLPSIGEATNPSMSSRIRMTIGFLCSFMKVDKWILLTYKSFKMCNNEQSKIVSIPSGRWHYFGSFHERETFCVTKKVLFEGRMWPVCVCVEDYLTQHYGKDYMKLPPPEKREEHVCLDIDFGE